MPIEFFEDMPVIGIVALVVFLGVLLVVYRTRTQHESELEEQQGPDPAHIQKVRELVTQEKYNEAATLQESIGNIQEAFNLFVRAKEYTHASRTAEELNLPHYAAEHAENAGDYARAADFYLQLRRYADAARLYQRAGLLSKAAEAMELDSTASVETLARLWESACIELMPNTTDPRQANLNALPRAVRDEVERCAERAAEAFNRSGDPDKAALFYRLCNQHNRAEKLRSKQDALHTASTQALPELNRQPPATIVTIAGASLSPPELALARAQSATSTSSSTTLAAQLPTPILPNNLPDLFSPDLTPNADPFVFATLDDDPLFLTSNNALVDVLDPTTDDITRIPRAGERYTLGALLGHGPTSAVYRCNDRILDRDVAIKFLPARWSEHTTSLDIFNDRVQRLSDFHHPCLVSILDHGVIHDRPFLCMELIQGQTLTEKLHFALKTGSPGLPLNQSLRIADVVLSVLARLHSLSIAHGDLRPANIILGHDDSITVLEPAFHSVFSPETLTNLIQTDYLSPEQCLHSTTNARSDLFSFGALLYHMLTGHRPYSDTRRINLPTKRPRTLRSYIPQELDDLVWSCIQLNPSQRISSADYALEIIQDLLKKEAPSPGLIVLDDLDRLRPSTPTLTEPPPSPQHATLAEDPLSPPPQTPETYQDNGFDFSQPLPSLLPSSLAALSPFYKPNPDTPADLTPPPLQTSTEHDPYTSTFQPPPESRPLRAHRSIDPLLDPKPSTPPPDHSDAHLSNTPKPLFGLSSAPLKPSDPPSSPPEPELAPPPPPEFDPNQTAMPVTFEMIQHSRQDSKSVPALQRSTSLFNQDSDLLADEIMRGFEDELSIDTSPSFDEPSNTNPNQPLPSLESTSGLSASIFPSFNALPAISDAQLAGGQIDLLEPNIPGASEHPFWDSSSSLSFDESLPPLDDSSSPFSQPLPSSLIVLTEDMLVDDDPLPGPASRPISRPISRPTHAIARPQDPSPPPTTYDPFADEETYVDASLPMMLTEDMLVSQDAESAPYEIEPDIPQTFAVSGDYNPALSSSSRASLQGVLLSVLSGEHKPPKPSNTRSTQLKKWSFTLAEDDPEDDEDLNPAPNGHNLLSSNTTAHQSSPDIPIKHTSSPSASSSSEHGTPPPQDNATLSH